MIAKLALCSLSLRERAGVRATGRRQEPIDQQVGTPLPLPPGEGGGEGDRSEPYSSRKTLWVMYPR